MDHRAWTACLLVASWPLPTCPALRLARVLAGARSHAAAGTNQPGGRQRRRTTAMSGVQLPSAPPIQRTGPAGPGGNRIPITRDTSRPSRPPDRRAERRVAFTPRSQRVIASCAVDPERALLAAWAAGRDARRRLTGRRPQGRRRRCRWRAGPSCRGPVMAESVIPTVRMPRLGAGAQPPNPFSSSMRLKRAPLTTSTL